MTCYNCKEKEPKPLSCLGIRATENGWVVADSLRKPREGDALGREWVAETPEQLSSIVTALLTEPVEAETWIPF